MLDQTYFLERYRNADTSELLERAREDLTVEAREAIETLLCERGIAPPAQDELRSLLFGGNKGAGPAAPRPVAQTEEAPAPMGMLASLWHGKAPLWAAFWVLGLGIQATMFTLGLLLGLEGIEPSLSNGIVRFFTYIAYIVWGWVIWRCRWRSSHWLFALPAHAVGLLVPLYAGYRLCQLVVLYYSYG